MITKLNDRKTVEGIVTAVYTILKRRQDTTALKSTEALGIINTIA